MQILSAWGAFSSAATGSSQRHVSRSRHFFPPAATGYSTPLGFPSFLRRRLLSWYGSFANYVPPSRALGALFDDIPPSGFFHVSWSKHLPLRRRSTTTPPPFPSTAAPFFLGPAAGLERRRGLMFSCGRSQDLDFPLHLCGVSPLPPPILRVRLAPRRRVNKHIPFSVNRISLFPPPSL